MGGGQVLAAIGNVFRNAAGSQARRKRNCKSPLVEKEAGGKWGWGVSGRSRPGIQKAVVSVILFRNQQLADSQRSRLESSRISEHVRFETLVSIWLGDVDVVGNMKREI